MVRPLLPIGWFHGHNVARTVQRKIRRRQHWCGHPLEAMDQLLDTGAARRAATGERQPADSYLGGDLWFRLAQPMQRTKQVIALNDYVLDSWSPRVWLPQPNS